MNALTLQINSPSTLVTTFTSCSAMLFLTLNAIAKANEYFVDTAYFQKNPKDLSISISQDIGNDPDDIFALARVILGMEKKEIPQNSLKEVITTFYKPEQKAGIAAEICRLHKYENISIYTGYGSDPKSSQDFLKDYPYWPIQWGIPGVDNSLLELQGGNFEESRLSNSPLIKKDKEGSFALKEFAHKFGESAVVVSLGPCSDIANALENLENIHHIVMMSGYLGTENGDQIIVARPGYNAATDLDATEKVLTQSKIPILIVNSQHIKDWMFHWTQEEVLAILNSKPENEFGRLMQKEIANYWTHKKPKPYGDLMVPDLLAVYIGLLHPDLIKQTMPVTFQFHEKMTYNEKKGVMEPIHMIHEKANTLFTVKKGPSNIHIVSELSVPPTDLRTKILGELVVPIFFQDQNSFKEAAANEKKTPKSPKEIELLIQNILSKNTQKDL